MVRRNNFYTLLLFKDKKTREIKKEKASLTDAFPDLI